MTNSELIYESFVDEQTDEYTINQLRDKDKFLEVSEKIKDMRDQFPVDRFRKMKLCGSGIKIGILDTGIDQTHPAFNDATIHTMDFVKPAGKAIDKDGHGTHCAGIIVANDITIQGKAQGKGKAWRSKLKLEGVAPKAELYVAKVLNDEGEGSTEQIANGFAWAMDEGVDIISMSLSGEYSYHRLFRLMHIAASKGIIVVVAAGNNGSTRQRNIGYPGRYGMAITVAANNRNGIPTDFSSRGGEIDMGAPGEMIWSPIPKKKIAARSGTSMAAPYIAGLAALLLEKDRSPKEEPSSFKRTPIKNNEDMREHILRMAAHPGHHNEHDGYGTISPSQYFWFSDLHE